MTKKATARSAEDGLTERQRDYIAAVVDGVDRVDAYLRSFGYEDTPENRRKAKREWATKLEKKPRVKAALAVARAERDQFRHEAMAATAKARAEQIADDFILTRKYVLDGLKQNAERAAAAVPVLDSEGRETGEYVANFSASNRALELLGKEIGMFREQKEAPGLFDALKPEQIREVRKIIAGLLEGDQGEPRSSAGLLGVDAETPTGRTVN